eukprot:g660.t1
MLSVEEFAKQNATEVKLQAIAYRHNISNRAIEELAEWHENWKQPLQRKTSRAMKRALMSTTPEAPTGLIDAEYRIQDRTLAGLLGRETIPFRHTPVMALVQDLLKQPELCMNAQFEFEEQKVDGERTYSHPMNALSVGATQAAARTQYGQRTIVMPIVGYIDETVCTKHIGAVNAKPLSMTLGVFSEKTFNSDAAKRVIGYLPPLPCGDSLKRTKAYKDEKRRMYHFIFAAMFRDMKQANEAGGIDMAVPTLGSIRVLPFILLIAVDHPEGHLAAAVSSSSCRTCKARKVLSDFANVDADGARDERNAVEEEGVRDQLLHRINVSRDRVTDARETLRNHGLHDVKPALAELPVGLVDGGHFAALPSDYLHLLPEGLGKNLIEWTVKKVQQPRPGEVDSTAGNARVLALDVRMAKMDTRHGDQTLSTKSFRSGPSSLTYVEGKDIIPMLCQLPVVLGTEGALLNADDTNPVLRCIFSFLDLIAALSKRAFSESDLDALDTAIQQFRSSCKSTFAGCCDSEFNYPKFHMITHLPLWIRLFGPLWVFDTSRWEEWHKEAVKHPYQRTTRRRECFLSEMSERVEYQKRLKEALQHIEQPRHVNEDESEEVDADVAARLHAFSGRATTIQSAELQQHLRTQLTKYLGARLGHGQNDAAARHDSRIREFDELIEAVVKNHDLARTLIHGKLRENNMLHLLEKIEIICRIILLGSKWDHEHVGEKFSEWIPEKFEAKIRSLIAGYCQIAKDSDADAPTITLQWASETMIRQAADCLKAVKADRR